MKRVLVCAVLCIWSGLASAVVYKWTDAQGKLQYGDRPPDGVHAEIVDMPGNHSRTTVPNAPAAASNPTAGAKPPAANSPLNATAKQAVDDDVAQAREKQCLDAQQHYKTLIEGRKLYKPGPDGERQYLTSEEIDTARLDAKRDVDALCNGQG